MRHRRARKAARRARRRHVAHRDGLWGHAKGRERERRMSIAQQMLRDAGCIASYRMAVPNSDQDRAGKDVIMVTLEGTEIAFGMGGSEKGMRKFMRMHPGLPYVNVRDLTFPPDMALLVARQFGLPEFRIGSGNSNAQP